MTYHFKDLALETADDVYVPAEDSILLAENVKANGRVLDIGIGTGIQALNAARTAVEVLGVDINPRAVRLAESNAKANNIKNATFRISDLFQNTEGLFDTIIFNPPYLPVDDDGPLGKAWAGGRMGTDTINRFIDEAGSHLNRNGRIFLLVSSFNSLEDVIARFRKRGLKAEAVAHRRMFFEELYVVCAVYKG